MDYSRSDILKMLARAMRASPQQEPALNIPMGRATLNLPEPINTQLPNLGGQDASNIIDRIGGMYQHMPMGNNFSIDKGKLAYQPGDTQWTMGANGMGVNGQIGEGRIGGNINLNGDWAVHGQHPMLGGLMKLGAQRQNGSNRYQLQYEKKF